ncbi:MAG TPA: ABC transporter ATP-binding protein [Candidatus Binataceae bacterium]|nr:ABC transporter ATP-binding protein [Candidatus Binataceae bacterium]
MRNREDDIVIVDGVSKTYRARNLQRQALVENVLRRMLGLDSRQADIFALRNVSLRVKRGEALGIVGGNGAGKSTLLKIVAGIASPSSGKVEVRGRVATQLSLGAGFHPFLTGRENIFLQGSILGMTNREIRELLPTIVEFAGIEHALDRQLWTYSSGMNSRLGFAIAAHVKFELLLLDEALSAGDHAFRERCNATLQKFREAGATMIIVSHGSENLRSLCDRAVWMDHGEVRACGPALEIIDRYEEANGGIAPRRSAVGGA